MRDRLRDRPPSALLRQKTLGSEEQPPRARPRRFRFAVLHGEDLLRRQWCARGRADPRSDRGSFTRSGQTALLFHTAQIKAPPWLSKR